MSFTYNPAELSTNPLYQVRFRLGDTNESTASFQDEEINYSLECNHQDVILTCIDCISALLPRLAKSSGFTVGPYSERNRANAAAYNYWTKLLAELRAKYSSYAAPIMLSPTTTPIFGYDMMNNGYAGDCHAGN